MEIPFPHSHLKGLQVQLSQSPLSDNGIHRVKGGFAPIFQAVLCLAILAGLLCLKAMDSPFYEAFSEWYHQEASQEIQLPSWETPAPSASPAPSPSPAASLAPIGEDASLQRI